MNNTNIFFTRYYHFHTTTLHIAFTKFLGWGCDFVSPWSKFFFFSFLGGTFIHLGGLLGQGLDNIFVINS